MARQIARQVIVYGNDFWVFYNAQKPSVQTKIDWVIGLIRELPIVPEKFLKHMEGTEALFELRVKVASDIFRIFCFFDAGDLVILLNGFQKKTDKTPKQEISRAEKLKKQYYEDQKG